MNVRSITNPTDLAKYENGDLLPGFHNILNRWKNYFC